MLVVSLFECISHTFDGEITLLQGILSLIINTVASILVGVLFLRFWMQVVRVRPPMSLAQFVFQLSDWLVKPLRRLLPGAGGYDWASLVGAFVIILIAVAIELSTYLGFDVKALFILSIVKFVQWVCYGFMATLIIDAILSWVNPYAPIAPFFKALNDPLLRPIRRFLPLIGNVDLSPLVALLLLQILARIVTGLVLSLLA